MDNQSNNTPDQPAATDAPSEPEQLNDQPEETKPETQLEQVEDRSLDLSQPIAHADLSQPFSWQAVEYPQINRDQTWYIIFFVIVIVLMALAIFVFKDIMFTILIPIMATAAILLTRKTPRIINYSVSPKGIYVADKLYDFSEFRAFGVMRDPEHPSITLLPVKRLAMSVNLYFDEADGEKIVDLIGARIPIEDIKLDTLEKIVRWTRL